jgi:hypothetical protein
VGVEVEVGAQMMAGEVEVGAQMMAGEVAGEEEEEDHPERACYGHE